ncbi:hypothetical protein ACQ4PT_041892 [Festuca glaucescens]
MDAAEHIAVMWRQVRGPVIVPLLRASVAVCLTMCVILFVEKVYMAVVITAVRLLGCRPERQWRWEPMREDDDPELGSAAYPMVLVQIPMYNEREVYQLSIGAACGLSWPSDRIVIQVLDDSTDPVIKEGMKHGYVRDCDFVAIFDADFQPEPNFLCRAMPFFIHNPEIALVQGRWRFGTAGVWRIFALNEAGGWKDRTTVEDMDLAVRASLKGWKFVYLGDLMVKSELPSTFKAFRYQQHRWSCGQANLFRKMFMEIVRNKKVMLWKRIYVIYNFFFVRKIIGHILTSVFYCFVIPATVFVPEIEIPRWGYVYIPTIITLLNAVGTPR